MSSISRLRIVQPCSNPLSPTKDSRLLHCEHCPHAVINLSQCTQEEADVLLEADAAQRTCVRIERNALGEMVLKNRTISTLDSRVRKWLHRAAVYLVSTGFITAWTSSLFAQSLETTFSGDVRVSSPVAAFLDYLEGSVGVLCMLLCFIMFLAGGVSLAVIKKRRKLVAYASIGFLLTCVTLFILRSFSATFFNDLNIAM